MGRFRNNCKPKSSKIRWSIPIFSHIFPLKWPSIDSKSIERPHFRTRQPGELTPRPWGSLPTQQVWKAQRADLSSWCRVQATGWRISSTIEPSLRGSNWHQSTTSTENHSARNKNEFDSCSSHHLLYMHPWFFHIFSHTLVRKQKQNMCSIHFFAILTPYKILQNYVLEKGGAIHCHPSQGMQAGSFRSLAQRLALPSYGLSWPRGLPRSQWPSNLKARGWKWEKREDFIHKKIDKSVMMGKTWWNYDKYTLPCLSSPFL